MAANMGQTAPDEEWLAKLEEPILEPDLAIVDSHHHLWLRGDNRYLLPEFATDLASGHNIVATIFAECRAMYRQAGPEAERSLGETEFVAGQAAMSAGGQFGPTRACAVMFGNIDMTLGGAVEPLLERLQTPGRGRFGGGKARPLRRLGGAGLPDGFTLTSRSMRLGTASIPPVRSRT